MAFKPIVNEPEPMDRRLFIDEPMGLLAELLNLNLHDRIQYDPQRNILFVNLEGWHARSKKDVDELRKALIAACERSASASVPSSTTTAPRSPSRSTTIMRK